MKVISVIGLKGGNGKTSAAVPLAWQASQRGTTVLLDLDPTLSATQWLGVADLLSDRLMTTTMTPSELDNAVNLLRHGGIQYLVLDTPPVSAASVRAVAAVSDLLIMPVHMGAGDIAQVVQTLELLAAEKVTVPVRGLMNHSGMAAVARDTRAALEGVGLPMLATEIPYLRVYVLAKGTNPEGWTHFEELWGELEELL